MSKRELRPYTDEELAFVEANMHKTMREVGAELGRPARTIDTMRRKVRAGWTRTLEPWTEAECEILRRDDLTLKRMTEYLPGRTVGAVRAMRSKTGASRKDQKTAPDLNPFEVRGRPLLAKTCPGCGLLLPSGWFSFQERAEKKTWRTECRKCSSLDAVQRRSVSQRPPRSTPYEDMAQAITLPLAENRANEYNEADHAVLSDPTLTHLAKALALKRTYKAVRSQCSLHGYKSHVGLGSPERDQWIIDNPNADRVDEITESLKPRGLVTAGRPDFEWDD